MWFLTRWLPHSLLFWFWNGRTAVSWRHVEASCGCKKCRWPLGRFQGWLHYSVCFFSWYRRLATIFYLFQQLDFWRNFFWRHIFRKRCLFMSGSGICNFNKSVGHREFVGIRFQPAGTRPRMRRGLRIVWREQKSRKRIFWWRQWCSDAPAGNLVPFACVTANYIIARLSCSTDSICCSGVNGLT